MKHQALEMLRRLREYALEQEQLKLVERQRQEMDKERDCRASLAELNRNYGHSVIGAHVHDYARRDGCVREAGVRHNIDLRQLGLAQLARRDQVQATLGAKTRLDMILKVLEKRQVEDRFEDGRRQRKELDDVTQNQFIRGQFRENAF